MYIYTPLDGEPYTSEQEPTDGDCTVNKVHVDTYTKEGWELI